jgi:mannosylglycerate hydrolase
VRRAPLDVPPHDTIAERPPRTAPLHRWVSRTDGTRTATLVSDGLAEYEALPDGAIAVTLVRAVGELSRPDLPERPGHAGWPVSTPEAQCLGPFESHLAIAFHDGAVDAGTIESLADDVLLPLAGDTLRAALVLPPPAGGVTLHGSALALSAAKASDDGAWVVLRCVNVAERATQGEWRVRAPLHEATLARLDETPTSALPIADVDGEWRVPFVAGPREVVTVMVR